MAWEGVGGVLGAGRDGLWRRNTLATHLRTAEHTYTTFEKKFREQSHARKEIP